MNPSSVSAFVPCMSVNGTSSSPFRSHQPNIPISPHITAPNILELIQNAIRDNHLGQALNLLTTNPRLNLPDHTLQELAAKLRVRGLPRRADLITKRLEHSASSTVQFLSRPHRPSTLTSNEARAPTQLEILIEKRFLDEAFKLLETLDARQVTTTALESLVHAAASAGQIKKAQFVLDHIYSRFSIPPTATAYSDFVDACGRAGNIQRAIAVLEGPSFSFLLKNEQSLVYTRLINACVRCDAMTRADAIVERMRKMHVPLTEAIYVSLLTASSRTPLLDRSLRILIDMRRDGFSPRTLAAYNALIQGSARAGRVHDAFAVYKTMMASKSVLPDLDTYNGLLASCAKAADPDRAFEVLDVMNAENPVYPNAKSYNWVVLACARVGDVDRALQVARRMRKEGIRLNIVTNNNLLEACCNAGRLERAFAMTKDMIQRQRVTPNSHTYDILIRGCGRWGLLDAALRLLSSMKTAGVSPTVITYSVAVDACARAGGAVAVDRAFDILRKMEQEGLEPNVVTYNSLIHACAQGKQVKLAFDVFHRMVRADVVPDIVTLCSLVDACGRAGEVERAFEAMEALPRQFPYLQPNAPAYNALMQACFKAGDLERMERAFADMKNRKLRPSVVTFSTLISAYAAVGDVPKSLQIVKEMKEAGLSPNRMTFTSIIAAYGRTGEVKLAMDMLEEARTSCGQPDEELYTAAIVAAVGGGRKEMAVELANEMSQAGYFVPTVLNRIMRKIGDVERSGAELRRVLSAMEALKIRPQRAALESLIATYAKEADVTSAFNVLPDMERLGYPPNIQTYKKLIQACTLSGKKHHIAQARSIFDMVRLRVKDDDPQLSTHNWKELYEAILRACSRLGKANDGNAVCKSLLKRMEKDCGEEYTKDVERRVFTGLPSSKSTEGQNEE